MKSGSLRLSAAADRTLIITVALLLLVPCFWQPHIIAGDLPSHVYNAWLADQIENNQLPGQGLSLASPLTNVLTDRIMEALLDRVGPSATERIVVGAAIEIFFWGSFFFVKAVTGYRCWIVAPSLAMITYGLIFHLGFLNFYVSTGLSLWLLVLLWHPRILWFWLAIPCTLLALMANPLPPVWALSALLYVHGVRRFPECCRYAVFLAAAALMILIRTILPFGRADWSLGGLSGLDGILDLTGVGQVWVYGDKYLIVVAGILVVWFVLFLERFDGGAFVEDPLIQIWGLSMVAYMLLPNVIHFPRYIYPLEFIQYRISLFVAILFCAMVAKGRHGRSLTRASALLAAAFFTMVYSDAKSLNRVEAELAQLVSSLPPGSPVVTALWDSGSIRLNGLIHVGSAACFGRCWDYGDYEPASAAFRVRVSGPSKIIAGSTRAVAEMEAGRHMVTPQEAPLYSVCPTKVPYPQFELRILNAGETTCLVQVPATTRIWHLPKPLPQAAAETGSQPLRHLE